MPVLLIASVMRLNVATSPCGAMWKAGKEGKPGQFGKDLEKFEALTAEGIDKVMDRLAKLNPFDEHKEPEYNGLDVMKLALSIITRAEKLKADADAGDEAAKIKLSKSNLKGLEVLKHALKTVNPDKVEEIAA
jgi:hypothetical protein